jgi:hypothetical protein
MISVVFGGTANAVLPCALISRARAKPPAGYSSGLQAGFADSARNMAGTNMAEQVR